MGIKPYMQKSDFRRFYENHIDRVYRFVLFRVAMDRETAQDLTSEIFIKALNAFESYDPQKSESAWIMTIARNHVINHWRDRKDHTDIDDVAYELMGTDGREEQVANEEMRALQTAMKKLEKKDRQLIELKYLQGFRYQEIGEMIGKTSGAVRIEAHRAMKKLKELVTKLYGSRHETP